MKGKGTLKTQGSLGLIGEKADTVNVYTWLKASRRRNET